MKTVINMYTIKVFGSAKSSNQQKNVIDCRVNSDRCWKGAVVSFIYVCLSAFWCVCVNEEAANLWQRHQMRWSLKGRGHETESGEDSRGVWLLLKHWYLRAGPSGDLSPCTTELTIAEADTLYCSIYLHMHPNERNTTKLGSRNAPEPSMDRCTLVRYRPGCSRSLSTCVRSNHL